MIELTGSEKQIEWAEKLRNTFQKELVSEDGDFQKLLRTGANRVNSGAVTQELFDGVTAAFQAVIDETAANGKAEFWIDNRDAMFNFKWLATQAKTKMASIEICNKPAMLWDKSGSK